MYHQLGFPEPPLCPPSQPHLSDHHENKQLLTAQVWAQATILLPRGGNLLDQEEQPEGEEITERAREIPPMKFREQGKGADLAFSSKVVKSVHDQTSVRLF